MNHIYRLVWSQVRRTWLVVSELARGRGKAGRTSTPRRARSVWWAALPLSLPMLALAAAPAGITAIDAVRPAAAIVAVRPALALTVIAPAASSTRPTGGQVTAGSGRIDYGDHLTTIQQNSQNLSLNWLSFNIGADSTVNFVQPNAQAIAVNRIADPNGSVILGHLNANGQVFLINPNGVLFGQGAQVNVGGLVASTLDVSDSELGRGTLHFAGAGDGSVTNRGTITAAPGGYVALLGHAVSNQGAIHAPAGSVALAGGSAVTLSFDGNHLLDVQVDASTLNALAENKQLIVADGGQVLMSAGAKNALLASVVNNTGTIQAQTVENRAGKIVLLGGMEAGTTQVDGTLDASAPNGGDGGFIETSAARVQVADGTKITTLTAAGNNGTWLIDPTDFTIVASGGDMTGATLNNQLGSGNVTIESSQGANTSGSGDIHVNDALTWSANTLTLTAAHDIDISAVMTAAGSAGLALNPATANGTDAMVARGTVNVLAEQGGRVDFIGNSNTLKISNQPYTIITALGAAGSATGTDLQGINGGLGGHYALGTNIDASATASWNGGLGFTPIGRSSTRFTGVFDGLGHTISGLTIKRVVEDLVGLFGLTDTGSAIRNLGLLGGSVTGNDYAGGLVGGNYGGTISHTYATGVVNGRYYVGGLVGQSLGGGTISQAHATGAVGGWSGVGGLVGKIDSSSISQAYATGTVRGDSVAIGGLVGTSNAGSIGQSYATGTVTSSGDLVGGLVGDNRGTIIFAYATGAVSGADYVGGLVGYNNSGVIIQTYATGAVSGAASVGGLIGYSNRATSNSYWDTETTGQVASAGGTSLTTTALIAALPTGFDAGVWANSDNQTTPYLLGMPGNQVFNKNDLPGTVTSASRPNLYTVILDLNQLQAVGTGLAGRYVLGNDIDASASIHWVGMEMDANGIPRWGITGFAPIGNSGASFTGIFDGLGYTINGLTIDRPNTDYVGLFGVAGTGSAIRNLGLLGGSVTGRKYVGGLAGDNGGTITGTYATGVVSGVASVDGDYVGGLVGYNDAGGKLTGVYATGTVGGNDHVGGLVGDNLGAITNAYATGAVTGTFYLGGGDYVGGLVGHNDAGSTITNTYATGAVRGSNYVGGLVGLYGGGTIIGSYWDTETTGQSTSDGGGTGLTTAQMMDPASFAAWGTDISAVGGSSAAWRIYAGDTAPLLRTFMTGLAVTAMNVGMFYNGTAFVGSSSLIFGTLTPGYWLPSSSVDASLILGDANARTSTPATNAGSYALAGDLYSGQMGYDIDFTPGKLTIAPATLTYLADTATTTYGSTPTGLTGKVTGFVNGETLASATTGTASFTTGATATSNVGNYAIVGNGLTADNGNYVFAQAAGNATALTINPATLTYTATSASSIYGNTPSGLTGTVTGFVNGQTLASATTGTASFTTGATATSNVGSYAIDGSGLTANYGNYTFAQAAGNAAALTINPATLTYTATSASSIYGNTPSGLTGTVTGFVNGETLAGATTGTASFTTVATATSNAGSYAINGSGLTANYGNYTFAQAAGNAAALTVSPAILTYLATSTSSIYGSTPSGLTGTVTGFVNGETLTSATTGTASFTTGATATSNVGSYAIDGNGLTANYGNYTFAQAAGNAAALTVNPATLTYLANTATTTYGSTPSGLTGTVTGFVNGETLTSATTGTASFTTGATATSNVGSYVIGGSGLTANYGNYTFAQAAGNAAALTVNPATLTYLADTATTTTYGSTPSGLTGTMTGFVNSQTLASATTGTASFTTGATATSNVGSYAIDGNGLTANYGNYTFAQAAGNAAALTVNPATLTYLADTATTTYGSTPSGLTGTVTGFVNGQTLASATTGATSFTTGATATSNVGNYAINGSGLTADYGNYTFAQAAGNATALKVNPAMLTYTATSASSIYGSTPSGLTGTVTGFVNGQILTSATTGTASFTTGATATSDVGNYAIDGNGLSANYGNYTFAQAAGNAAALTVNPAILTITANDASKTYGDTLTFAGNEFTASGLQNGETIGDVALTSAGAAATASVTGGPYTITSNAATGGSFSASNYAITYKGGNLTVGQAALTVTANDDSKTYDGLAYAGGHGVTYSGFVNGETASVLGGTLGYAGDSQGAIDAGSYLLTPEGLTSGNYAITYDSGTLLVNLAALVVTANDDSKTYNGLAYMGGHGVIYSGFVNGETALVLGGTLAYTGDSQGAINAGGYTITPDGLTAGNYAITYRGGNLTVGQAALTVTANDDSKTYDGLVYTGGHGVTYSGFVNGETTSVLGGTLGYAGDSQGAIDAGSYLLTPEGLTSGNYAITYDSGALLVNLAALVVTATDASKTYDGLAYTGGHGVSYSGFVNGETAAVLGGTLGYVGDSQGATNAGSYLLTPEGLTSGNYAIDYEDGRLTVDQAALTVSTRDVSKTYDGGLSAIGTAVVSGGTLFGNDTLSGGSFAFTDKQVGTGKHVTVNGVTVSDGNSGGNYAVTYVDNTGSIITALGITVDATGTNRVYDGTTADAVNLASTGLLVGDTVLFSGIGAFGDKNVGIAKAVGVSSIVATGADANNYSFNTSAHTTADITAKPITIDATGVDKVYDGSTAATISALGTTGLVAGDVVTFGNTAAAFDDKNAGTGKTITVNGIAASGTDAGNYSFSTSANTTANISQLGITVDATGSNKVYDGTTVDAVTLASTGVLSGDTVNFTGTGHFVDKNVGAGKSVSVSGIVASGSDAGNYSYNAVAGTTADIAPATLTYRANTASFWTGQIPGDLDGTVTGLVGGDTLAEATAGTLGWNTSATSGSPAGTYAIDGSGLSALNYLFAQAAGNASVLRVANGSAPAAVTAIVAGLQRDDMAQDRDAPTLHAPDVRVVGGGVRLP